MGSGSAGGFGAAAGPPAGGGGYATLGTRNTPQPRLDVGDIHLEGPTPPSDTFDIEDVFIQHRSALLACPPDDAWPVGLRLDVLALPGAPVGVACSEACPEPLAVCLVEALQEATWPHTGFGWLARVPLGRSLR